MSAILRDAEIRLAALALSPEYVYDAARAHGGDDLVAGVPGALAEVRGLLRTLARQALARAARAGDEARAGARRDVRLAFQALGALWHYQAVEPLAGEPFRELAPAIWDRPEPIADLRHCRLPRVAAATRPRLPRLARSAVLRAVGEALERFPDANRALLPGRGTAARAWRRRTGEILLHLQLAPGDLRPVVLRPAGLAAAAIDSEIRRHMRTLLAVRKHPLDAVGRALLARWMRAGFLVSPGGAMVSDVGALWADEAGVPRGIRDPDVALLDGNGVPIAIGIGEIVDEAAGAPWLPLRIVFDHRVLDAHHARELHPFLERRVGELVEESLCG